MRFLNKIKCLSDAQSGFRPSDSCEYQLLSIVHDIYKSFILASSVPCREVRDSWITEASKAIIIAVTISEGKHHRGKVKYFLKFISFMIFQII